MIRKAEFSDIDTIMSIINETVEEMKSYGNTQWDNNYPNNETFINATTSGYGIKVYTSN